MEVEAMARGMTFIAAMGVFLKQQQTTAQKFMSSNDELCKTAARRLKHACSLLLERNNAWNATLGPIVLAAVDQYLSTLVSVSVAVENERRVRARFHRNSAIISLHRGELLILHAHSYCDNRLQGLDWSLADGWLSATAQFTEGMMTATIKQEFPSKIQSESLQPPKHTSSYAVSDWSGKATYWSEEVEMTEQFRNLLRPVGSLFPEERLYLDQTCFESFAAARHAAQAYEGVIKCQQAVDGPVLEPERSLRQLARDLALEHVNRLEPQLASGGDQPTVTNDALLCSDALTKIANVLGACRQRQQQFLATLSAVPEHRSTVQTTLDASAERCDEVAHWVLDSLATSDRLSEMADTCSSLLYSHPDAAAFYLAQYYSDQYAAASQHVEESEYHSKLAEYWGEANGAMKQCLSRTAEDLSTATPLLSGIDERASFLSMPERYRAQYYEASAVRMCQEAIAHHTRAERIRRTLHFRITYHGANQQAALVEAAAAWESAAGLALTAAERSAASVRAANLSSPHVGYYDRRFIPAQLDGDATRWAELAQALEESVVAPAAVRWLEQQTIVLRRHLRQQHEISHRGGTNAHHAWQTCHRQCAEVLTGLIEQLEITQCDCEAEVSGGTANMDERLLGFLSVALKCSDLLQTYREQASAQGMVIHPPHYVAVELCGCLAELCAGGDSHAGRTALRKHRVQVLLLALDAHIHALHHRHDILYQAADYLRRSLFPRSADAGAAFERVSDSLLDNQLSEQELVSLFGEPLPKSPLAPGVSDDVSKIVQAVLARADTTEKLRSARGASHPAARKCYADAVASLDRLSERLIRGLEQRVEGNDVSPTVAKQVRLAEESAEAYLMAAHALAEGEDELGRHWRRVAYCSLQHVREYLTMNCWLRGSDGIISLEAVAKRSRAAAVHLARGEAGEAVVHAYSRASDYAVLELRRDDPHDSTAKHYLQMGDCWEGIARALETQNEPLQQLWEEKKKLVRTLRPWDSAQDELRRSRYRALNLSSSALNIPEEGSVASSAADEEVEDGCDYKAAQRRLDQVEAQIRCLEGEG